MKPASCRKPSDGWATSSARRSPCPWMTLRRPTRRCGGGSLDTIWRSGEVRVPKRRRTRRLLSEDLQMLRSLASVFGFMLETVRLQHKRQEQELVAQGLRLQTSRSELKALRAQINPALPVQCAQRDRLADSHGSCSCRRGGRAARRSVPLYASPVRFRMGAARPGADVRSRLPGRGTGTLRQSSLVRHRLGSPAAAAARAVDAAADAHRERRQARRLADARPRPNRGDRAHHGVGDRGRGTRQRSGPGNAPRRLPREGTGFGLRSVRERLAGHFGARAELSLTRDAATATTIARIVMPIVRVAA